MFRPWLDAEVIIVIEHDTGILILFIRVRSNVHRINAMINQQYFQISTSWKCP